MTDSKARLAVFISGGGTGLQSIIDASGRGDLAAVHGEIQRVDRDALLVDCLTRLFYLCGGQRAGGRQVVESAP